MSDKNTLCNCINPILPDNLPLSPFEYKGQGKCGKCDKIILFPLKSDEKKINIDKKVKESLDGYLSANQISIEAIIAYYLSKLVKSKKVLKKVIKEDEDSK